MVYRIRIMKFLDGKLVFDHYATEEELKLLKPHTDGRVYKRSVTNKWEQKGFIYDSPYGSKESLFSGWQDVSETHFVEWGVAINDKPIYESDIVDWCEELHVMKQADNNVLVLSDIHDDHQYTYYEDREITLLGNVWENPELVEGK